MSQQTILPLLTIVSLLAMAAPVFAQTAAPNRDSQSSSQMAAPIGQSAAPIGHRQPRVGDLPQTQSDSAYSTLDRPSPEDEAMNRRINGICRGC